jgi:hypothetical protein
MDGATLQLWMAVALAIIVLANVLAMPTISKGRVLAIAIC